MGTSQRFHGLVWDGFAADLLYAKDDRAIPFTYLLQACVQALSQGIWAMKGTCSLNVLCLRVLGLDAAQ